MAHMRTLFVDEAGHSGRTPFADPNQAFHVSAGVTMDWFELRDVEKVVGELRARFSAQATELKGSRLLRSSPGRKLVNALLKELRERETKVSVVAVHKAHYAAGVLVEDCTDYANNPRFDPRWTWPIAEKKQLVDWIAGVASPRLLSPYLRARVSGDTALYRSALHSLVDALLLAPNADRAVLLDIRSTRVESVLEASSIEKTGLGYSPNLLALRWMLSLADRQAVEDGFNYEVLHDDQEEFREEFVRVSEFLQQVGQNAGNDKFAQYMSTRRMTGFSFDCSGTHIGLQTADCLAAAVNSCLRTGTAEQLPGIRGLLSVGQPQSLDAFGPASWQEGVRTIFEPRQ